MSSATPPLLLTYSTPGDLDAWESAVLPIGNGTLAASIFGGPTTDHLVLNEKSLWSGGPGVPGYRHGNYPEDEIEWRHQRLAELRGRLADGGELDPALVMAHDQLGQAKVGYGSMQTFGRLEFGFDGSAVGESYRRTLDLATGVVRVAGDDGAYVREYLCSHPDRVVAARFTGTQPVSFDVAWNPAAGPDELLGAAEVAIEAGAGEGTITLAGVGVDNGLRYAGRVVVRAVGGSVAAAGSGLRVTGADEVLLLWSGGTDYANRFPDYRSGVDPAPRVAADLDRAADLGWAELRARHVADHGSFFGRLDLDLGGAPTVGDTSDWVEHYGQNASADRHLEVLHAQYGRYLMIASSRAGDDSLPANLQGGWNHVNTPPWGANYHVNINLQMNYWHVWAAGLAECAEPYLRWIHGLLEPGRHSARNVLGTTSERAWLVNNETNVWGFTGVYDWPTAAWFAEAGAWLAQAFWWHQRHTGESEVLREQGWPVLVGACELWLDTLQSGADQALLASPSYSPEHGWFTAGAAMSQQIVHELFTTTLEAAAFLGLTDDAVVARLTEALPRLADGLEVRDSEIAEWRTPEVSGTEEHHRHTSQLYALHPGRALLSHSNADDLRAAARATLDHRGDEGTGWSKAWKVNFWARLGDGDRAHRLLGGLLSGSTMANLWDTHPPFQIDGNFGATAGVLELLVRSDLGGALRPDAPESVLVDLLPALPSAWREGRLSGARTWGGLEVDVEWRDAQLQSARLTATRDVEVSLTVAGALVRADVRLAAGESWELP
ncbi:glycosyl hydrolase family 95 catalytic domain-containing protein [Aestuariimicrobium soli]|uniref:glycosyl hydrolase family 95 catalytic domain-containing protein n=1 Tax=Aestuariimicrobium soli TaxID=2035834 RepID=UPI003EBA0553